MSNLSVYWTVLLAALLYTNVDINVIHKNYTLKPIEKGILFIHALVIFYLLLGMTFTDRFNTMTHLIFALATTILWNYHGHCILSMFMEQSVGYNEEDYKNIIMEYPDRQRCHLGIIIPVIVIDVIKLLMSSMK